MRTQKIQDRLLCIIMTFAFALLASGRALFVRYDINAVLLIVIYLLFSALPFVASGATPTVRLRICRHGQICLCAFAGALALSVVVHIVLAVYYLPGRLTDLLFSVLVCFAVLFFLFWNGMICVYLASVQLGIRRRAIGLLCGFIPIVNLIALRSIIRTVRDEVRFETEKYRLDAERAAERVCGTRYPIVLVHGVFFRDYKFPNYWGRIPATLGKNGAVIYYGEHQSAASVADSAQELAERIRTIVEKTGCEKVNLIAHSKGGLDCRYALAHCGIAPLVASLTTVNTPHRGCEFADYLLDRLPQSVQQRVANAYNAAMRKLGDSHPDFMAAVSDLRADRCACFDRELTVPDGVYTQSIGSLLHHAVGGKFPLNFTYPLVKCFDGANDGLVSESSFSYGENYIFVRPTGTRGISHADMIDLNRENIPGFDVREFYVKLVCDLRERGF